LRERRGLSCRFAPTFPPFSTGKSVAAGLTPTADKFFAKLAMGDRPFATYNERGVVSGTVFFLYILRPIGSIAI